MFSWLPRTFLTILFVSLAAILVLRVLPAIPISSVVTQKTDLFTVSGEGKVTVIPDTAVINVGINLAGPTVKQAQSDVNSVINTVSAATKKLGVDAKDIKTANYSIRPEYDYKSTPNRITGYRVSTSLTIRVRDLEKINAVIDTATQNGANTVSGIQLTVDEDREKELLQQARQQAVSEAKAKAEQLAGAAGVTLGRIVNVQESGSPFPVYRSASFDMIGAPAAESTSIEAGSTDITASVTLFYETR